MCHNTPASPLTETSILYTDGHIDTRTDGPTDRLIPVCPQKHSFCGAIKIFFSSDYRLTAMDYTLFFSIDYKSRLLLTVNSMKCTKYKNPEAHLHLGALKFKGNLTEGIFSTSFPCNVIGY